MKKLFSTAIAFSFAAMCFTSVANNAAPDASPEAKQAPVAIAAPVAEPAPAVNINGNVVVPEAISQHLAKRFPGRTVQGITREGVTYVVDLGDGLKIRYDNCFNPICYGDHSRDSLSHKH